MTEIFKECFTPIENLQPNEIRIGDLFVSEWRMGEPRLVYKYVLDGGINENSVWIATFDPHLTYIKTGHYMLTSLIEDGNYLRVNDFFLVDMVQRKIKEMMTSRN